MEAVFRRTALQGALALALTGFSPPAPAGMISGVERPIIPSLDAIHFGDLGDPPTISALANPPLLPAVNAVASDLSAARLPAPDSLDVVVAAAAPRPSRFSELVTGLSETGTHVTFAGGLNLDPLAGIDRGGPGRRSNSGGGGLGNASSTGATGGSNARARATLVGLRSETAANDRVADDFLANPILHDPSLPDAGSLVAGLPTDEPGAPLGVLPIPPPIFEFPAPLPTIDSAANDIDWLDAPLAAVAVVASEPTGIVIMGAGLSGLVGVSLTAYGINSRGTRKRSRKKRDRTSLTRARGRST